MFPVLHVGQQQQQTFDSFQWPEATQDGWVARISSCQESSTGRHAVIPGALFVMCARTSTMLLTAAKQHSRADLSGLILADCVSARHLSTCSALVLVITTALGCCWAVAGFFQSGKAPALVCTLLLSQAVFLGDRYWQMWPQLTPLQPRAPLILMPDRCRPRCGPWWKML